MTKNIVIQAQIHIYPFSLAIIFASCSSRPENRQLNESGINYDVCMLAYNLMRCDNISGCNFLLKVIESQTASAYIIKRHYYDVLLQAQFFWKSKN